MRLPPKLIFIVLFLLGNSANSGIDKFTRLDIIENWEIERRIDSETQGIRCRASIPNNYAWFGGKIRLNPKGKLIIPDEQSQQELPNKETITKITNAIKTCENGLIYKLNQQNK